jgi:predicted benzoate:H+ symporter BenE
MKRIIRGIILFFLPGLILIRLVKQESQSIQHSFYILLLVLLVYAGSTVTSRMSDVILVLLVDYVLLALAIYNHVQHNGYME